MLASLAVFIIAFTMGGLNYITTVLQSRAKGMTLMRMPPHYLVHIPSYFPRFVSIPSIACGSYNADF